jgi:Glyoxalase-like domain
MGSRWCTVVIDALDPGRLARWWAEVLDFTVLDEVDGMTTIGGQDGPRLVFVQVPDGKAHKNRLHLELDPDDQDAEVERLLDMGARRADVGQPTDVAWVVLADPEGNEFCVLARPDAEFAAAAVGAPEAPSERAATEPAIVE